MAAGPALARDFAGGGAGTDRIASTQATRFATRSYGVWFNWDGSQDAFHRIFENTANRFYIETIGSTFRFECTWSSAIGTWDIAYPTTDTWHFLGISYDDQSTSNDPIIWLDTTKNTVGSGITEAVAPVGTVTSSHSNLTIGNRSAGNRAWSGGLAEFAQWSKILDDDEFRALASGRSPLLVAPQSLVECVPMLNDNVSLKLAAPTVTGTTVIAHPRIIYPARRLLYAASTAAATTFPLSLNASIVRRATVQRSGRLVLPASVRRTATVKRQAALARPVAVSRRATVQRETALSRAVSVVRTATVSLASVIRLALSAAIARTARVVRQGKLTKAAAVARRALAVRASTKAFAVSIVRTAVVEAAAVVAAIQIALTASLARVATVVRAGELSLAARIVRSVSVARQARLTLAAAIARTATAVRSSALAFLTTVARTAAAAIAEAAAPIVLAVSRGFEVALQIVVERRRVFRGGVGLGMLMQRKRWKSRGRVGTKKEGRAWQARSKVKWKPDDQ